MNGSHLRPIRSGPLPPPPPLCGIHTAYGRTHAVIRMHALCTSHPTPHYHTCTTKVQCRTLTVLHSVCAQCCTVHDPHTVQCTSPLGVSREMSVMEVMLHFRSHLREMRGDCAVVRRRPPIQRPVSPTYRSCDDRAGARQWQAPPNDPEIRPEMDDGDR